MSFIYNNKEYSILDMKGQERPSFEEIDFLEITKEVLYENNIKNPIMFDIGANVGNHSIYYEKEIGAERVLSFEPIVPVFDRMVSNFKANGITNTTTYNVAISSREADLTCISRLPDNYGSYWLWYNDEEYKHPADRGYTVHKGCDGSSYTSIIQSIPLNKLNMSNIDRVDFIKIDVEGMELEVLNGSSNVINKYKPMIQIEVAIDNETNVLRILSEMGYNRIRQDVFKYENQLWILT